VNIVWASCVGRTFPKPSIGTDIIVGPAKADVRDQFSIGRRSIARDHQEYWGQIVCRVVGVDRWSIFAA
jgi:hypothetical protein